MTDFRDRREEILARLATIFGGISGVTTVGRNREEVSGRARPALFLHDADEEEADLGKRPRGAVRIVMTLTPTIYILLEAKADEVGPAVSELRAAVIPAIWTDSQLWQIVGSNGDIRYVGCALDTGSGESREARLDIKFEFNYMLDSGELSGTSPP